MPLKDNVLPELQNVLKAGQIFWSRRDVRWLDSKNRGIAQFGANYLMNASGLPAEFIFEHVMRLDFNNDEKVLEFCGKWGLPFSPFREQPVFNLENETKKQQQLALEAISLTEELLAEFYYLKSETREGNKVSRAYGEGTQTAGMCISLAEARHTLSQLSEAATSIQSFLRSGGNNTSAPTLAIFVLAACNPTLPLANGLYPSIVQEKVKFDDGNEPNRQHALPYARLNQRSLFTSAIANQLLDIFADSSPWRMCQGDDCNRIFKHKSSLDTNKRFRQSLYCSDRCYERQKRLNKSL